MSKVLALVGMGSGVSAGVARRFGQEGFKLAMVARSQATLDAARAELEGIEAVGYLADAGQPASLDAAFARISVDLGPTSVLVYNAAAVRAKPGSALAAAELIADLGVSIGGALTASQCVLPAMLSAGTGTILYTGGAFALEPTPVMTSLGIGKAGLRNSETSHSASSPN